MAYKKRWTLRVMICAKRTKNTVKRAKDEAEDAKRAKKGLGKKVGGAGNGEDKDKLNVKDRWRNRVGEQPQASSSSSSFSSGSSRDGKKNDRHGGGEERGGGGGKRPRFNDDNSNHRHQQQDRYAPTTAPVVNNAAHAFKRINLKKVVTHKKALVLKGQKKAEAGRKGKRLGGNVKKAMKAQRAAGKKG